MKEYKVWIEIEEYDTETGEGETLDVPFAFTAVFDKEKEAISFAADLDDAGAGLLVNAHPEGRRPGDRTDDSYVYSRGKEPDDEEKKN